MERGCSEVLITSYQKDPRSLLLTDSWIIRLFLLIAYSRERVDAADESRRLVEQVEGLLQYLLIRSDRGVYSYSLREDRF